MADTKVNKTGGLKSVLKSNTMIVVLVGVMILFEILIRATNHGSLFAPANITNIIRQNAYVAILATGMLCCILTGGNIDLSVGSVVALVGALAGVFIEIKQNLVAADRIDTAFFLEGVTQAEILLDAGNQGEGYTYIYNKETFHRTLICLQMTISSPSLSLNTAFSAPDFPGT